MTIAALIKISRTAKPLGLATFAEKDLVWTRPTSTDWPDKWAIGDDHRWARKTLTGLFCDLDEERLFLIQRDWSGWPDPPEWGLASLNKASDRWRYVADFDELPSRWIVPEVTNASN